MTERARWGTDAWILHPRYGPSRLSFSLDDREAQRKTLRESVGGELGIPIHMYDATLWTSADGGELNPAASGLAGVPVHGVVVMSAYDEKTGMLPLEVAALRRLGEECEKHAPYADPDV